VTKKGNDGAPGPWSLPPWIKAASGRSPVPPPGKIERAERLILEEFKQKRLEDKLEDRPRLVKTLLDLGKLPAAQPEERFARLRLAARLAAESGDYAAALEAVELLGQCFDVETALEKADLVLSHARFARNGRDVQEALACACLNAAFEAMAVEDY